jgi:SAM-dependent methyltransferase
MAPPNFWDALAPHHSAIENSYLDLPSLRRIIHEIQSPAVVVGAGQGLIVAALQKKGIQCDGVDLSPEMIRYAKIRRGLDLIHADAMALPFANRTYKTIIYATGVIDFMSDEDQIRAILAEARRIANPSARIFVAFCRLSSASEDLMKRLGLLSDNAVHLRELLEVYRLKPLQALGWLAKRSKAPLPLAVLFSIRSWLFSSWQEKRNGVLMKKVFAQADHAETLIRSAPEKQPYRDEPEIRKLFTRLAIPIKHFQTLGSCHIVRI